MLGHRRQHAPGRHLDAEEAHRIALHDSPQAFARDRRHVGAHGDLIDRIERFDAFAGSGEGEVAAEEEFVDHLELMGSHEGIVGDPWAAEQSCDVGIDIGMLSEENEHFIDPGIAHVRNDDF